MNEAVLVIAALAILSLLANMLPNSPKSVDENEIGQPVEHIITAWRETEGSPSPVANSPEPVPRRITVEYGVAIQADSAERLSALLTESVAAANEDFQRQFASFLEDEAGSGVVRIEPVGGQ